VPKETPEATDDYGTLPDAPGETTHDAPQPPRTEVSAITLPSFLRQTISGSDYTWGRYLGALIFYLVIGAMVAVPLNWILGVTVRSATPNLSFTLNVPGSPSMTITRPNFKKFPYFLYSVGISLHHLCISFAIGACVTMLGGRTHGPQRSFSVGLGILISFSAALLLIVLGMLGLPLSDSDVVYFNTTAVNLGTLLIMFPIGILSGSFLILKLRRD